MFFLKKIREIIFNAFNKKTLAVFLFISFLTINLFIPYKPPILEIKSAKAETSIEINKPDSQAKLGIPEAQAGVYSTTGGILGGAATGAAVGSAVPVVGTAIGAVIGAISGGLAGYFLPGVIGEAIYFAEKGIAKTLDALFWVIATILSLVLVLAANLANWVLQIGEFVKNPVVQHGWNITKGLANLFFVLILLIIAFAAILRIETYGLKKALPKLIIAALLINFSMLIAGIIIDFSQVISNFFIEAGAGTEQEGTFDLALRLSDGLNLYMWQEVPEGTWEQQKVDPILGSIISGLGSIVFILGGIVAFLLMAFLLIIRIMVLWFLIILAPLAWLAWILPNTASMWNKWWHEFLRWAFLAPILAFFIYLALFTVATGGAAKLAESGFTPQPWLKGMILLILNYVFLLFLLFGGLITANKMSFYGASGTMTVVKWAGKGAAGGVSRWLATGAKLPITGGRVSKAFQAAAERRRQARETLYSMAKDRGDTAMMEKARRLSGLEKLVKAAEKKTTFAPWISPGAWRRTWPAYRKEIEARAYARPTGNLRDQLSYALSLGKERTRFGEQAEEAEVNRRKKEISDTSRSTEFLLDGLEKSSAAGNKIDTSAYIRLLFEQNDQNEIIKQTIFGSKDVLGEGQVKIVSDENVTKAVYAALEKAGFSEEGAAKIAMDLGNISFTSGNYMTFGMGIYDLEKGRFRKTEIEEQRAGGVSKASNLEAQQKTRGWHWNSLMEEIPKTPDNPLGIGHLHGGGKELLKGITAGDIEQLNRTRGDFQTKVGSEKGVKDMQKFADELEKTDSIQASLIRKFAAQLHGLRTGKKPDWYEEDIYGKLKWLSKEEKK